MLLPVCRRRFGRTWLIGRSETLISARNGEVGSRWCSRGSGTKRTASMTAPVVGSCGLPACTARVPKLWTGDGARGGVSMEPLMFEMEKNESGRPPIEGRAMEIES